MLPYIIVFKVMIEDEVENNSDDGKNRKRMNEKSNPAGILPPFCFTGIFDSDKI